MSSGASQPQPTPPPGWLPAGLNRGWIYRDRVAPADDGEAASAFYAARYRHSDRSVWRQRLEAGEVRRDGHRLRADDTLAAGDRLAWHRPPWQEASVPGQWSVVHDDGDLYVIDKPAGLPVLPAGGHLEHTVLRLLERRGAGLDPSGRDNGSIAVPRPVHRLGRFTSGLLVCARRPGTRAWLSALLRESTAASLDGGGSPAVARPGCRKVYRALTMPLDLPLAAGESLVITTPIGRRPHPRLGWIWAAMDPAATANSAEASSAGPGPLPARSRLTLLERRQEGCLVEVAIGSGRPHQIRIHLASVNAPLLGDPLFLPGGYVAPAALPGDGGYQLHAHRLSLPLPGAGCLELEAPCPPGLRGPPGCSDHRPPQVELRV